jgi:hypothetical protein
MEKQKERWNDEWMKEGGSLRTEMEDWQEAVKE